MKYHKLLVVSIFLMSIIFMINSVSAAWTSDLNDGLQAYWTFNSTNNDSLGINNLTLGSEYDTGIINQSYSTSGTYYSDSNVSCLAECTINFWANYVSGSSYVINSYNSSGDRNGAITFYVFAGTWAWNIGVGPSTPGEPNIVEELGNYRATGSGWGMYTLTLNSTTATIYQNGSYVASAPMVDRATDDATTLYIFSDRDGAGIANGMFVDEMSIWNKTLNDSQVSQLYNSGNGITYSPPEEQVIYDNWIEWGYDLNNSFWDGIKYPSVPGLNKANFTDNGGFSSIIVVNGTAYFTSYRSDKVYRANASNISQVYETFQMPGDAYYGLITVGEYTYAGSTGGIYQLNSSNISQLINRNAVADVPYGILAQDEYVYFVTNGATYQVNRTNVSEVVNSNSDTGNVASNPSIKNGYLYVASTNGNVYQLYANNLTTYKSFSIGGIIYGSVAVTEDYVFIGKSGIMYQLNATDISQSINSLALPQDSNTKPTVVGNYVYFSDIDNFYKVNYTNISQIQQTYTDPPWNTISYYASSADEKYLYLAQSNGELKQINLSDITQVINQITITGANFQAMAITDKYLYVVGDGADTVEDAVYMFNASNISTANYEIGAPDTTAPSMLVVFPTNTIYNYNVSELNYTISDDSNLSSCWYSTDLGATNYTITCGTNVTGLIPSFGSNTWTIWANDTLNNVNMSSVTFEIVSFNWTESLDNGLLGYWNLNETSGTTAVDSFNSYDFVTVNANQNPNGKIGYGYNPSSEVTDTGVNINGWTELTINIWAYINGTPNDVSFIRDNTANGNNGLIQMGILSDNTVSYDVYDSSTDNSFQSPALNSNSWYMITMTINSTGMYGYVNGTLVNSAILSGLVFPNQNFWLFSNPPYNNAYVENIIFDEFSLHNRSLNTTEITQLYNFGDGITRPSNETVSADNILPLISIDYPLNITYYDTGPTELNYTVNDENLDACWYTLDFGVTNNTITCGTNVTGLTSNLGRNYWEVWANDTYGNINYSSVEFYFMMNATTGMSINNLEDNGNTAAPFYYVEFMDGTTITYNNIIADFAETNIEDGDCVYEVYLNGNFVGGTGDDLFLAGAVGAGVFNVTYVTSGCSNYTGGTVSTTFQTYNRAYGGGMWGFDYLNNYVSLSGGSFPYDMQIVIYGISETDPSMFGGTDGISTNGLVSYSLVNGSAAGYVEYNRIYIYNTSYGVEADYYNEWAIIQSDPTYDSYMIAGATMFITVPSTMDYDGSTLNINGYDTIPLSRGTSPENYGNFSILINGVNVNESSSGPLNYDYAFDAGTYDVYYRLNGSWNYFNNSVYSQFVINKATPSLGLVVDSILVNYGDDNNITASYTMPGNISDCVFSLYRNGVLVNTSTGSNSGFSENTQSLLPGHYDYVYNVTECTNYNYAQQTLGVDILDTSYPPLRIYYPLNISYNYLIASMNFSTSDIGTLDACWYSLNGGITNITIDCNLNITGLTSIQGSNRWTMWANDTSGNTNTSNIVFYIDSINPNIYLVSPVDNYETHDTTLSYSYFINDASAIKNSTLYVYNQSNSLVHTEISYTLGTISKSFTLGYGNYTWYSDVWDIYNNYNVTGIRHINITPAPIIPLVEVTPTPSGGGNNGQWVIYAVNTTAINITLNSIELDYSNTWRINYDNKITVKTYGVNGQLADIDMITVKEMNNMTFYYSVNRLSTGIYEIKWRVKDVVETTPNFKITATQGSKEVFDNTKFVSYSQTAFSGITGRAVDTFGEGWVAIKNNWLEIFMFLAILIIVVSVVSALSSMRKR